MENWDRKSVVELKKGDTIKFEFGDFEKFIVMAVEKKRTLKKKTFVYGKILSTDLNICSVGDDEKVCFCNWETLLCK